MPTSSIRPNTLDRFNAYRQVVLTLPPNRYLSNQTRTDRIRTTPAVTARGRKRETIGQFDVVLVIEDKVAYPAGVSKFGNWKLRRGLRRSLCGGNCRTAIT